jgi:hypothetical protein
MERSPSWTTEDITAAGDNKNQSPSSKEARR